MRNKILQGLVLAVIVAITSVAIEKHLVTNQIKTELGQIHLIRDFSPDFPLINPILSYDTPEFSEFNNYKVLKNKIIDYIDGQTNDKKAENISVYFRDLNTTNAIDVNPQLRYTPASLYKVPLLITYLKSAEVDPKILQNQITRPNESADENTTESIKPSDFAKPGQTYTIDQLLQLMIKNSDNNAALMLFNAVNKDSFAEVFTDFHLPIPNTSDSGLTTPKDYSFFIRILYNSTYLNKEMSQKALQILADSDFRDGLAKGVPENVPIAHKFGEYAKVENNQTSFRELHDCGIIYEPDKPYFLCIMTKGQNLNDLKDSIKSISEIVYREVSK